MAEWTPAAFFEIAPQGEDGLPDWAREVAATTGKNRELQEANAHLIAAAPALLEAAEAARENDRYLRGCDGRCPSCSLLVAAIAAAKGERS